MQLVGGSKLNYYMYWHAAHVLNKVVIQPQSVRYDIYLNFKYWRLHRSWVNVIGGIPLQYILVCLTQYSTRTHAQCVHVKIQKSKS